VGAAPAVSRALVWHRGDLRVHDHAALCAALQSADAVAGIVVLDPANLDNTSPRRRALFMRNVIALRKAYARRGGELIVRTGQPAEVLPALVRELRCSAVHALRSHSPYGTLRDTRTGDALLREECPLFLHDGLYVQPPGTVLTRDGRPFSVYGPWFRRWSELVVPAPLDPPSSLPALPLPTGFVVGPVPEPFTGVPLPAPGEQAALRRLDDFVERRLDAYVEQRDRLDGSGGARISIDLTVGSLSARVAYHRVAARTGAGPRKWIAELAWRDFMADLLHHRPAMAETPMDAKFIAFPWRDDDSAFASWRDGLTGVPVVDAAMRELGRTGWISGRARMVAAQFLTKHLQIDWRRGEQVFRHLLLDGDAASNIGNWQWAAGLGVDNAPYFRVFNPVTQGREHDPDGSWLRRWVPESGGDARLMPNAIVDLAEARREYLLAVEEM
jgi:deoxyribodipyrimidine photo-lyase